MKLKKEQLAKLSNEAFAAHVLHGGEGVPFFSSNSDPSKGYPYSPTANDPTKNNFYCVSKLTTTRRVSENFSSLHVIVVDDVGSKLEPIAVEAVLGVPSYKIQTSPRSQHWGYVLEEPVTDRAMAEGLIAALCRTFTSDMAGVNRVARLPVGSNTKKLYGSPPPRTKLLYLDTEKLFSAEDLAKRLDAQPEDFNVPEGLPFLPSDEDPVLRALEEHGLNWRQSQDLGKYHITCPWVSTHTNEADNGSAYIAPHGFRCWHAHCSEKTFADLREFLGLTAEEIDQVANDALARSMVGDSFEPPPFVEEPSSEEPEPAVEEPDSESEIEKMVSEWENSGFGEFFDGTTILWDKVPKPEWVFDKVIQQNAAWYISGEGGIGKSRLALALCISLATGKPFGGFIPPPEGRRVIFLTHEDDRNTVVQRMLAQWQKWHKEDPFTPEEMRRVHANLKTPGLKFGQKADEVVDTTIRLMKERFGEHGLVLFDPLIAFWDEGPHNEFSINSMAGATHTFERLISVAAQDQLKWSMAFMHHLNKEGGVYGSQMIKNQARAVFDMTLETEGAGENERRLAKLVLCKANNARDGQTFLFELAEDGTLWPTTVVRGLDPEAVVATHIRAIGRADRDTMMEWAATNPSFGDDKTTRCGIVLEVLQGWAKTDEEELAVLGLVKSAGCTVGRPAFVADPLWGLGLNEKPEEVH